MEKYRYEDVKALAYAALMSALSLIFVLISFFMGDLGIILILVLPLFSALVSINVNLKYSLIYIIATFLISLIDPQLALFAIIPSLISGFLYGKMIVHKIHGTFNIISNTLLLTLLQYLGTFLIDIIYEINLIETMSLILKIEVNIFDSIYLLFLFSTSLIECSLSYLIITNELKKLNYCFNENKQYFLLTLGLELLSIIICFIFSFGNLKICYLFLGISLFFGVSLAYYNFQYFQQKFIIILQFILYLISLVIIFSLFPTLDKTYQSLLILVILLSQIIVSIIITIKTLIIDKRKIDNSIFDKLI